MANLLVLPRFSLLALSLALSACAVDPQGKGPATSDFKFSSLAKTEVDQISELHLQASRAHIRLLAEKLYKRNPREWRKSAQPNIEAALARIFDNDPQQNFPELQGKRSIEALNLAFREDFHGDRVLALTWGLASMSLAAYNDKSELYAWDDLDPQKLYNAARNMEIAAWQLASKRDSSGHPLLLSNEIHGDIRNLSFEREWGKLIAEHDMMAQIVAGRTNRTIVRMVQNLATAFFIPLSAIPK